MNEIAVFEYGSAKVRTAEIDGEPFFIAKDICVILEIANVSDALCRLDDDEKGIVNTDTLGGKQAVWAVTESGLYSLILTSRKPEAKAFKKWVTLEVLPSIRKTGSYTLPKNDDQLIIVGYEAAIRKIRLLEKKAELDAPKVETAEALTRCDTTMSITDTAKHFGLHPKKEVFPYLRRYGYLTSRDLPTQDAINKGIMTVRQNPVGNGDFYSQAVVKKSALDLWRTTIIPRIQEWAEETAPAESHI